MPRIYEQGTRSQKPAEKNAHAVRKQRRGPEAMDKFGVGRKSLVAI